MNGWSRLASILGLMCVLGMALFGALYVSEFNRHVEIEMLSGDAIRGALPRWIHADSFWNLTHHNHAQAPIQVLFMLADIYIGPYPYWSRTFVYLTWTIFFFVVRSSIPAPRGNFVAAIGLALWFCYQNRASLFTYPWVHVEVACQLLSLSGVLLAGIAWSSPKQSAKSGLFVALGLLVFIFSHAHKGFYYPLTYAVLGTSLAATAPQRRAFVIFGIVYVAYIVWIDGFLISFTSVLQTDVPKNYAGMPLAVVLLATGAIGSALKNVSQLELTSVRVVLFLLGLALGADALRRVIQNKDPRFVPAVAFIWPALGMVSTTVLRRFDVLGYGIQEGERYLYNSVFFLIGILMYFAVLRSRFLFMTAAAAFGTVGGVLVAFSGIYMPHYIRYFYTENTRHFARALNPDILWEHQFYGPSVVRGFQVSQPLLKQKGAEVYTFWGFRLLTARSPPNEIQNCAGVKISTSHEQLGPGIAALVSAEIPTTLKADMAVIWSASRPVAMSYILKIQGRAVAKLYATEIPAASRLILYERAQIGGRELCEGALLGP